MKNKKIAILLVIILVLMQIMPTYAATATGSNADAATPSNADEIILESDEFSEKLETLKSYSSVPVASASNAGIMLMSDGDNYYTPDVVPQARVYDSSGAYRYYVQGEYSSFYSTDTYDYFSWPTLTNGYYYGEVQYDIQPSNLPKPGMYGFKATIRDGNLSRPWISSRVSLYDLMTNVTGKWTSTTVDFTDSGTYSVLKADIEISYDTKEILAVFSNMSAKYTEFDVLVPKSSPYEFTYTSQSSIVASGVDGTSSSDVVANSSIQISENTASIADSLKELIKHISDQLAALWDQLYNYMHLPHLANDDKNTQSIIDTLTNGLSVEVENNDDNTEEIIHGYDQSGMDSSNDALSDSIDSYNAAESEIFDDVQGYISDYEMPDFASTDSSVLSALSFCSDYLQRLFVAIGAFNVPITVSLVMIFVLMLLGYYRVRSSG